MEKDKVNSDREPYLSRSSSTPKGQSFRDEHHTPDTTRHDPLARFQHMHLKGHLPQTQESKCSAVGGAADIYLRSPTNSTTLEEHKNSLPWGDAFSHTDRALTLVY
ncbi:unnamed protein product [Leuciscus chuanchicus]